MFKFVFLTNNICETIHQKISNCLPHSSVTKKYFRDTLSYVLKQYSFKNSETIRKDYIIRTLIILIYKYNLNENPKFLSYEIIKKEIEETMTYMTGKVKLKLVQEIFNIELELTKENNTLKDKKNLITYI